MHHNKNIVILFLGMLISGCGYFFHKTPPTYSNLINQKEFDSFKYCQGKGYISSKNPIKGKLYFSFNTIQDSSDIHIRDFLGRSLYTISGTSNGVFITNHLDKIKHNLETVMQNYSLDQIISTSHINKFLRGIDPLSEINVLSENLLKIDQGSIVFSSSESTEIGVVDTVVIHLNEPKIDLTISITERFFFNG